MINFCEEGTKTTSTTLVSSVTVENRERLSENFSSVASLQEKKRSCSHTQQGLTGLNKDV